MIWMRRFCCRWLAWSAVLMAVLGLVEGAAAQSDIPANVLTTAKLSKGTTKASTIDRPGDADWFKVTLGVDNAYRVVVTGPAVIRIYDNAGVQRASSGTGKSYVWGPSFTGTYFVAAEGTGTTTGAYKIGYYQYEEPASTLTDSRLIIGRPKLGQMRNTGPVEFFGTPSFPADEDWLYFNVQEPGCYLMEATMERGPDWVYMVFRDRNGSQIESKDCNFFLNNKFFGCVDTYGIYAQIDEPGRYYISLTNQPEERTNGGTWRASVTRKPELEVYEGDEEFTYLSCKAL